MVWPKKTKKQSLHFGQGNFGNPTQSFHFIPCYTVSGFSSESSRLIVLLGNDSLGKTIGVAYFCSAHPTAVASQGSPPVRDTKPQHQCPGSSPDPRLSWWGGDAASPSQEHSRVACSDFEYLAQKGIWPPVFALLYKTRGTVSLLCFLFWIKNQQILLKKTSDHFFFFFLDVV